MLAAKVIQALGMEGNVALWNDHSSKGEEYERPLISDAVSVVNIAKPNPIWKKKWLGSSRVAN